MHCLVVLEYSATGTGLGRTNSMADHSLLLKLIRRARFEPRIVPASCGIPREDTMENATRAVLSTPPKKRDECKHLKKYPRK